MPRQSEKRRDKEPDAAIACDLKKLKDRRQSKLRAERFRYLMSSGKRPVDPGPTPPEAEQEFWKQQVVENPFILCRHGAFLIKSKIGVQRYFPGDEQLELTEFRELCWFNKWVCDIWELKCRQYGGSTEAKLADVAVAMAVSLMNGGAYSHTVGNEVKNTMKMLRIIRTAIKGLPLWLRPELTRDNDGFLEIDDEKSGFLGLQFQTDTAKKGEDIGRGDPAQIRHYTEADWWFDPEGAFASLEASQVWEWPAHQTIETTGKRAGSTFNAMYEAAKKPDANNPGRKSFFFSWFRHKAYRKRLPAGLTVEDFWDSMMPEDRERFEAHGCDHEQANWYLWKRQSQLDKRIPLDLFRREFPFDDVEAFLGGTFAVFDQDRLGKIRTQAAYFKRGQQLGDLELTAYPCTIPEGWSPKYARCRLRWDDEVNGKPYLEDSPFMGDVHVWERCRRGHDYVIAVDIAENKLTKPGVIESGDWSDIEVGRITFDRRVDAETIGVAAQARSKTMGVLEAARAAVALSKIYPALDGRPAPICFERNNNGVAFEVEVKRLGGRMHESYKMEGIKPVFMHYGIQVTGGSSGEGSKKYLVSQFVDVFLKGEYTPRSVETIHEMGRYTRDESGKYGAPSGEHDDAVSGGYLLVEAARARNRGAYVKAVVADGGLNLAEQPDDAELINARLEALWKQRAKRLSGISNKRRTGGWRGGI